VAKDYLSMLDYSRVEIEALLGLTDSLREAWHAKRLAQSLKGRRIALIWDAGGFRNRVAFELGIAALGATAVLVPGELDVREPIEDVTRYLANWVDAIVARTRPHSHMLRLARASRLPVVNARTDFNHPCEILADLAYIRSRRGRLDGLKVAFVGEATNLCHPWMEAAARLPIAVVRACPKGYEVDAALVARLREAAVGSIETTNDLDAALAGADVVYTDCWPKRPPGARPADAAAVAERFLPFQVTAKKLKAAGGGILFLPCPPVKRGEEVSADAMEAFGSTVYEAKEYLLHAQNAVLTTLLRVQAGD
jgi:ornithine carbamoyltransferase